MNFMYAVGAIVVGLALLVRRGFNGDIPEGFFVKDGSMKFPHGSKEKNPFLRRRVDL